MGAKRAALLVMAKMALSDGKIADEEREFMLPYLAPGESLDELLAQARGQSLAELVAPVDRYADRFFIALRAASMAAIDEQLDAREEALYEKLVNELAITEKDRAVIQRAVAALSQIAAQPVEPRLEELFAKSSFAEEDAGA